jgi:CelD/BcsL family acetyltransferase involved in cellulose biosynthesis
MSLMADEVALGKSRSGSLGVADAGVDITVVSQLAEVETTWREFQTRASCTPFQTYEWLSTWQRTIGAATGALPLVVLLQRHGELAAIIPLELRHERGMRVISFLGHEMCDYNGPLLAPSFAALLPKHLFLTAWKEILQRLRVRHGYDVLILDKLPETIGRQSNPFLALPTSTNASGAHNMALGRNWESFYSEKRSSNTRRHDRAKVRKMEACGAVSVSTASEEAAAALTLESLIDQKTKWFESRGIPNLFSKPGVPEFFLELAKTAPDLVHISELKIGSSCAAANLGLRHNACYYHILASHGDGPATRFGPGALHLREIIRFAIEDGCETFDFTIGDEPYKFEWADQRSALYDHVSGAGFLGDLFARMLAIKGFAKRTIKNTPALWKAASLVRRLI